MDPRERARQRKDQVTLVIARTLVVLLILLAAGALAALALDRLGVETGGFAEVFVPLAALVTLTFLVRHRHD